MSLGQEFIEDLSELSRLTDHIKHKLRGYRDRELVLVSTDSLFNYLEKVKNLTRHLEDIEIVEL